ncbi:MAG: formylglycine-generating enzyme family protein [Anaerolineae bacterium]|nr:formylglycine-generating enzyme family protein [Anaerolineae bacterium]
MMGSPVRRRTRDSGWQWLVVGMMLGMGCSLVFCLASYVAGFIEVPSLEENEAGQGDDNVDTVQVITATAAPVTPTATPTLIPTLEEALSTPRVVEEGDNRETTGPLDPLSVTPVVTLLPSSNNNLLPSSSPGTPSSSLGQGGGLPDPEIGTPFPLGPPTFTPSVNSGATPVPDNLLSLATAMVDIPGGTFTMGTTREEAFLAVNACVQRDGANCNESMVTDSIPAHQVTISDYRMEIYEVSTTQYVAFLNQLLAQNPGIRVDRIGCQGNACVLTQEEDAQSYVRFNAEEQVYEIVNPSIYSDHPIIYVTWWGAATYCEAIGRRLPTEAEWERAARGPANSIYPWGQEWIPTNADTSRSAGGVTQTLDGTSPVTAFPSGANPYGLLNMAGNVSEWVFDWYQENYYALPEAAGPDPRGAVSGTFKVARGGGWENPPLFARTVHRLNVEAGSPRGSLGFRCAANR